MLNGVEISKCERCNVREGVTRVQRTEANASWMGDMAYPSWINITKNIVDSTNSDGSIDEHKLLYIDARFNNLCNLRCRTCSPHYSTSWHKDYETLGKDMSQYPKTLMFPGNNQEHLLEEILPHIGQVKRLYFAGGEPLMQIEHYKILEELIKTENYRVSIIYSTNFSTLKLGKHNACDYWNKLLFVHIQASLDGSYKRAEYWRKGTDWNEIVENIQTLRKQAPNVTFNIGFTLSWPNAFNLVDLHKEWTQLGYIGIDDINVNILDSPTMYSLKSIPNFKKKKIETLFNEQIQWLSDNYASSKTINQYRDAINFMNSVDTNEFIDVDTFVKRTEELDKLRNENFWEVFPEHQDMKEFIYGLNTL